MCGATVGADIECRDVVAGGMGCRAETPAVGLFAVFQLPGIVLCAVGKGIEIGECGDGQTAKGTETVACGAADGGAAQPRHPYIVTGGRQKSAKGDGSGVGGIAQASAGSKARRTIFHAIAWSLTDTPFQRGSGRRAGTGGDMLGRDTLGNIADLKIVQIEVGVSHTDGSQGYPAGGPSVVGKVKGDIPLVLTEGIGKGVDGREAGTEAGGNAVDGPDNDGG